MLSIKKVYEPVFLKSFFLLSQSIQNHTFDVKQSLGFDLCLQKQGLGKYNIKWNKTNHFFNWQYKLNLIRVEPTPLLIESFEDLLINFWNVSSFEMLVVLYLSIGLWQQICSHFCEHKPSVGSSKRRSQGESFRRYSNRYSNYGTWWWSSVQ